MKCLGDQFTPKFSPRRIRSSGLLVSTRTVFRCLAPLVCVVPSMSLCISACTVAFVA